MKPRMTSCSPSMNRTWPGMSLRVVNMKVKYHSGLMPERRRGEGIGLFADLPGQEDADDADEDQDERPAQGVLVDEIGEEGDLLELLVLDLDRDAHAQRLDEEDVDDDEDEGGQRAEGRRGTRRSGRASPGRSPGPPRMIVLSQPPDEGQRAGDVRPDPGGEVGQLVPGQEVAAEAEGHEQDEEEEARHPGQLAGLAVGLQEEGREHVDEEDADQDVGRPAVDRADEPAELDRLMMNWTLSWAASIDGRVVEEEHDPRGDLEAGQEEG